MRILIISYFFPPYNTIGAVRVGKTAKYLTRLGHEVKVLTASNQPLQPTLHTEIPAENILSTPWFNVNGPVEMLLGGRTVVQNQGYTVSGPFKSTLKRLGRLYRELLNFPDGQIGWLPHACRTGEKLLNSWKPDVIYASAMPNTSLLVAKHLANKYGVPWFAEFRDLWLDNPNYKQPHWRRSLESKLEGRVLASAKGFITVSEPLAERLRAKFPQPVKVILNGFDPEDYPNELGTSQPQDDEPVLHIAYTGMVYEGRQDPSPLFEAIRLLGPQGKAIRVSFYGRYLDMVRDQAKRQGVENQVRVMDAIPYSESLKTQRKSDVLLLLMWNDTTERGVYTGKLFEYLGARRPILAIGQPDNVAAELIQERDAGAVLNDPTQIAEQLLLWLRMKNENNVIPAISEQASEGLSRESQVRYLETFITGTINGKA